MGDEGSRNDTTICHEDCCSTIVAYRGLVHEPGGTMTGGERDRGRDGRKERHAACKEQGREGGRE